MKQGGTTKSVFALGKTDSSTLTDRGSDFQSQREFYFRFDLWISSMLKTTPVTAPSLQAQCIIGPNLFSKQEIDTLWSACLDPPSPQNSSHRRARAVSITPWKCPFCTSCPRHSLTFTPHQGVCLPLPPADLISRCLCYFYITFGSCLTEPCQARGDAVPTKAVITVGYQNISVQQARKKKVNAQALRGTKQAEQVR